ncbi:Uncharacterised protein [BD1-7 clade bacterium]|nr:Uncharacterised protein [BD1-7 clade bacterium]
MISFWEYTHKPFSAHQFGDISKSKRLAAFLESKDILYSYKIDHLKRHWVSPHIEDRDLARKLMEEFEGQDRP